MDNQTQGPDLFDRMMGALHQLPDVTSVKPTSIQHVEPIIGATQTFIIQTHRQRDQGDTIFLQCVNKEGSVRIAIPPAVSDAIARQRDALTGKTRSKAAKANAQARKDAGLPPGFMKGKKNK